MKLRSADVQSGWIAFETESGLRVFVWLAFDERGELVVRDLVVSSENRITADDLRGIAPNRIEAGVNGMQWLRKAVMEHASERDEFIAGLRSIPKGKGVRRAPSTPRPTNAALPRPDGTNPEHFYAQVAEVYRAHAAQTSRPAAAMADAAGVPVGTARRWIAEARRRGHLPAGQKGRAG